MAVSMKAQLAAIVGDDDQKIKAIKNLLLDEECLASVKAEGKTLKPGRVNSGQTLDERLAEILGDQPDQIAQVHQVILNQVNVILAKNGDL
jgi:hypothetical protein